MFLSKIFIKYFLFTFILFIFNAYFFTCQFFVALVLISFRQRKCGVKLFWRKMIVANFLLYKWKISIIIFVVKKISVKVGNMFWHSNCPHKLCFPADLFYCVTLAISINVSLQNVIVIAHYPSWYKPGCT